MSAVLVETTAIRQESSSTLTAAKAFKITSAPQFSEAGERLKSIMGLKKKIAEIFDPHIKRAHEAHKSLVAEKKTHEDPLVEAEGYIKRAMLGYQQEQERIRREAEAKAQEEARKERERLEARAAKAVAAGKTEKAEALQQSAAAVVTPIIAPTVQKISGISTRTTYKATVTDKLELVKACAAGKVPLTALDVNMPFLNNQARQMKETLAYPGVKVEQETGISSRSA
jgi:hypothetical protein